MRLDELVLSPDDSDPNQRLFTLKADVTYEISGIYGLKITVPAGFKTDFASLPPLTRSLVDWFNQKHRVDSAGVLHDFLYATHGMSRTMADAAFYQELRERKIPRWQAKLFFYTLNIFGKRAYRTGPVRLVENCPDLNIPIGEAPDWEGDWVKETSPDATN